MSHPDTHYPDRDLVTAYIARKGVKTFHTEELRPDEATTDLEGTGATWCDLQLSGLTEAGWARGLSRQGLSECSKCSTERTKLLESLENGSDEAEEGSEPESPSEDE